MKEREREEGSRTQRCETVKKVDISRKRSASHLVLNPLIEFQLIHVGSRYSTFRKEDRAD